MTHTNEPSFPHFRTLPHTPILSTSQDKNLDLKYKLKISKYKLCTFNNSFSLIPPPHLTETLQPFILFVALKLKTPNLETSNWTVCHQRTLKQFWKIGRKVKKSSTFLRHPQRKIGVGPGCAYFMTDAPVIPAKVFQPTW